MKEKKKNMSRNNMTAATKLKNQRKQHQQQSNIKQKVVINRSESCLFINNEYIRFQQPLVGAIIHSFHILYNLSL